MDRRTEIQQAIRAADEALFRLREAQAKLKSAGNWGIADLLGGGLISTVMKHTKLNDAQKELADARSAMQRLAREVRDVDQLLGVDLNMGDFLTFADFFFDGMIADWMMQSKIKDAQNQVAMAISRVTNLRYRLTQIL